MASERQVGVRAGQPDLLTDALGIRLDDLLVQLDRTARGLLDALVTPVAPRSRRELPDSSGHEAATATADLLQLLGAELHRPLDLEELQLVAEVPGHVDLTVRLHVGHSVRARHVARHHGQEVALHVRVAPLLDGFATSERAHCSVDERVGEEHLPRLLRCGPAPVLPDRRDDDDGIHALEDADEVGDRLRMADRQVAGQCVPRRLRAVAVRHRAEHLPQVAFVPIEPQDVAANRVGEDTLRRDHNDAVARQIIDRGQRPTGDRMRAQLPFEDLQHIARGRRQRGIEGSVRQRTQILAVELAPQLAECGKVSGRRWKSTVPARPHRPGNRSGCPGSPRGPHRSETRSSAPDSRRRRGT
ncbi:MAG: hypothetical protein IPM29_29435 [Planctomycetes bacterium]|nr:hypothetical protein [Planctomycetota bacterium]